MSSVSSDHRNKIITKCTVQSLERSYIKVKDYSELNKLFESDNIFA